MISTNGTDLEATRQTEQSKPEPCKPRAGQPTKYRAEYASMAAKAASLGATDVDLAELFDVNPDTIATWKLKHPRFSEAIRIAKNERDEAVEKSLYERAKGYELKEDVLVDGAKVEITKRLPPSEVACIFWLKNRQPKRWRDVQKIEHSGNIILSAGAMSAEQLRQDMIEKGELSPDGKLLKSAN